jgi:hypothetical protein
MSETPRADFWFSIAVTVLGVAVVAESLRMPRLENLGVHPMSAPGLTPGLIGLVLAGLGAALFLRTLRVRAAATAASAESEAGGGRRLAISMALCLIYAIVLLGWLPFWLATGVFVFAFVLTFTWQRRAAARLAATAAALAISVAAAVTLLFERVFLVHLP